MISLPAEAYAQSEYFQREKLSVFTREWLCFAATGQLPTRGDFVTHTIGGWPIFAIRGEDGAVRGFRNVCRHQQMPVLDGPAGQCGEIRCRFHGWTYDLRGALIAAPERYPPAQPIGQVRLDPIEVAERGGLLFSRLEPRDATLPPILAPGEHGFAAAVTTDVDGNWKSVVESLLGDPHRRFSWPNAFDFRTGDLWIVRQIVPRTFSRTRLIDLVFAPGGAAVTAAVERTAQADKTAAEAFHAALVSGKPGPDSALCGLFRSRVETLCAAAARNTG